MPTYAEMMQLFDFKSKNAVYRVVTKLIAAGIVTKDKLGKEEEVVAAVEVEAAVMAQAVEVVGEPHEND